MGGAGIDELELDGRATSKGSESKSGAACFFGCGAGRGVGFATKFWLAGLN